IHLVEPDGRVLRVRQVAYRAVTEAGIKSLAEDLFEYDRDQQDFHLVRAVTLDPDGTEHAVAPDAILVQSPQRRADLAIYDDTTEVRIIYPRVRVGGVTHAITVVQDRSARLPGAYTYRRIWGGNWPQFIDRHVVELPAVLAPRLNSFTLGSGVPEPVRQALPDSAVRLEWRGEKIPSRRSEVSRAPTAQTGPLLHLTTLRDWDEVAAWYQSLLAGRDTLPPELATLADEWLRDAPDRDAKIAILFSKVADEVRYTSLSLGEGDYQPRSPSEVWARRHGDCKDKSNLLVALLRHAGIPAHLTLLNTRHLGLVDRRAPDYRVFDHAIVALPGAAGGYAFLDPTIACATPAILAPTDADRDVLVVRDGRADWARTPPHLAGRIDYAFDLALNPAGEISGWLTVTADGIYGAWERERYRDLDTAGRLDNLARTIRGFFPGAEIVDVVVPDASARTVPAVARAYFLVAARSDGTGGTTSLRFPSSRGLFLDLGTTERRDTTYFIHRDEVSVRATFALPPGTSPTALPAPFQVETPTGRGGARWIAEPGLLRAELDFDLVHSTLPPREFPRFYQAMLALDGWLAQSLTLGVDTSAPAPAAPTPANLDLPLMPTGAGQLELIEKRYPFSGDRALRRAALQRAIQYFPNDAAAAYEAGIYLAILDWNEDKNQETVDRVTALLAAHRHVVSPGNVAWGESLRALALRDLGRTDEAVETFTRIARDPNLGAWRRSQDALNAAQLLEPRDSAAAASVLLACAPLVSEKQLPVLARLSRLLVRLDRDAELRECLAAIGRAQPAELDGVLAHLTADA
ncbi:MAG: DUF3857 domain-containing protein, partial [Burkholderiales bacterium]|nr:DUF3857 domain-containing protein [Opitutaceae bacterium]